MLDENVWSFSRGFRENVFIQQAADRGPFLGKGLPKNPVLEELLTNTFEIVLVCKPFYFLLFTLHIMTNTEPNLAKKTVEI